MIVSFSSFSLLATPVEMAASFAQKKTKNKRNKRKEKENHEDGSSENVQKHCAQQTTGISNSIHENGWL